MAADVELFFDPVCPFCWVTSTWLRQVQRLRGIDIAWRFISLAVLNDRPGAYDDKPDLYPTVHGLGRRLLRVAAARDEERWDEVLVAETEEALARVGDDVGTPILSFSPPDGPAFFGPVISDTPSDDDALRYGRGLHGRPDRSSTEDLTTRSC